MDESATWCLGGVPRLRADLLPCPICESYRCRCHQTDLEDEGHDRHQPSWCMAIAANA